MLEILKTFDAIGIAMGTHGYSRFGTMRHISLLVMTTIGPNGIDLSDAGCDHNGYALVRVTMPPVQDNDTIIKELTLGDRIRIRGFVCKDKRLDASNDELVVYGTRIERLV